MLCTVYTGAFIYTFTALGNLGLIQRERVVILPFLLVLLCTPRAPARRPAPLRVGTAEGGPPPTSAGCWRSAPPGVNRWPGGDRPTGPVRRRPEAPIPAGVDDGTAIKVPGRACRPLSSLRPTPTVRAGTPVPESDRHPSPGGVPHLPTIEENFDKWNDDASWHAGGEAWSRPWGDSSAQWYGCVYPRVRDFLPAATILEIAPGFGRWTEFLLPHCEHPHRRGRGPEVRGGVRGTFRRRPRSPVLHQRRPLPSDGGRRRGGLRLQLRLPGPRGGRDVGRLSRRAGPCP